MNIEITYVLNDESSPQVMAMSESEYFDSEGNDRIPRCDHAWQYLDVPKESLLWTRLRVVEADSERSVCTSFFAYGKGELIHVSTTEPYEELILTSPIDDQRCSIARMHRNPEQQWKLNTNVIVTTNEDGTESEMDLTKTEP